MNAKESRRPIGEFRRSRYVAPDRFAVISWRELLHSTDRDPLTSRQFELLASDASRGQDEDIEVFVAGDIGLLRKRCVSIVGTRDASRGGAARASRLARELVQSGVTVVSGLARGIDTAALTSAIEYGGRTVAVIGTPLSKAYPAENAALQERIWREHLLLTPFREGVRVFRANFPIRNRVMAAVSDAAVIIEASDTSGTLHQAAECQRLGRWLFIAKSVVDDASLSWPRRFVGKPKVAVLQSTSDIMSSISGRIRSPHLSYRRANTLQRSKD
jgi:DNA processing protein